MAALAPSAQDTGQMDGRVVLACEGGLAIALRSGLLGGYDGAGSWRIFVEHVSGKDEHLMVQVHEAMHHELQTSTLWGCLTAMSAVLAATGLRRHALEEVFDVGIELSTGVHEAYATFLADAVGRERASVDVLVGNPQYAAYRDRASRLLPADPSISEEVRVSATAAVLRCCMQPFGLAALAASLDFKTLTADRLRAAVRLGPDERLAALEANSDPTAWLGLLAELTALAPQHQARILREHRPTMPADLPLLEEQWQFETEHVQRRCYELASNLLATVGDQTLGWEQLGELTGSVATAAAAADPALAEVLRVGDSLPLNSAGDILEFSRQQITLRERLPAEFVCDSQDETLRLLEGFIVQSGTPQVHVCGLWASPGTLRKQFDTAHLGDDFRPYLFTKARTGSGGPVARFGPLASDLTSQQLQALIHPLPLLTLTTHYALEDDRVARALVGAGPVFVVMDLPIGWHVDHWIGQGAHVRYAVATVDREKELGLLVVRLDRAPHLRMFHIGGLVALGSLFERLRQRHDTSSVTYDQDILAEDISGYSLATSHVLHAFHTLDQDAAS